MTNTVGLSIDGSDSSDSSISSNEGGGLSSSLWGSVSLENDEIKPTMTWDMEGTTGTGTADSPLNRQGSSASLPLLPSECDPNSTLVIISSGRPAYRSRARRRLEEISRASASDTEEEFLTDSHAHRHHHHHHHHRHPTRRTLKFFMALTATALVCISQGSKNESRRSLSDGSQREEIVFFSAEEQQKLKAKELPKFYLPKLETTSRVSDKNKNKNGSLRQLRSNNSNSNKRRPNVALARSHESLPVFGQVPTRPETVERFYLGKDDDDAKHYSPPQPCLSWTTVIAGMALMGMVFDTMWKEFRRFGIIRDSNRLEQERRL
jgi:hypothetical protein